MLPFQDRAVRKGYVLTPEQFPAGGCSCIARTDKPVAHEQVLDSVSLSGFLLYIEIGATRHVELSL